MIKSLLLQFLEALRASIESDLRAEGMAGPSQRCVFLDRIQPVGENEVRPLVIVQRRPTVIARDSSSCALDHSMAFDVKIYVTRIDLLTPFSELVDPVWQVVHRSVMASPTGIAWCQGIEPTSAEIEPVLPDGEIVSGLMVCAYTVQIMTSALDLTAIP